MFACVFSEASPSVGGSLGVHFSVPGELGEHLFGLPEVFPGAFGAHVDAAVGVARPAVLARIEEVVRVHVRHLLVTVVALAVQPVLRLQGRGDLARAEVVEDRETQEEGERETLYK